MQKMEDKKLKMKKEKYSSDIKVLEKEKDFIQQMINYTLKLNH